mgnify:CR=1 FL=1
MQIVKLLKTKECSVSSVDVPLKMAIKLLIYNECSVCDVFLSIYIFILLKRVREGLRAKIPFTNLYIS